MDSVERIKKAIDEIAAIKLRLRRKMMPFLTATTAPVIKSEGK